MTTKHQQEKQRDDILKRLLEMRPEPHKKRTPRAKKKKTVSRKNKNKMKAKK